MYFLVFGLISLYTLSMKSKFYLPTYEECLAIVKANENFFEKKTEVDGVPVSIFNYRLATLTDFLSPLGESSQVQASELRGLTFVHEKETRRFVHLHKFFNLDQTQNYMYSDVKDKSIVKISDKADGSMIRFVPIKNKLYAKTKVTFLSDQAVWSQQLMERDAKMKEFLEEATRMGLAPILEYTSFNNQIVVQYAKAELLLLQLRDESTGEYLDVHNHDLVKHYGIKTVAKEPMESLATLMEKKKTEEGREGWIVHLDDGQMLKIKTQWYLDRHGLLMEGLVRENSIVQMILNETLDDAMSLVGEKDVRRTYSMDIQKAMAVYLERSLKEVKEMISTFNGSRKDFALANKDHAWFGVAIKNIESKDEEKLYDAVKAVVAKKTSHLMEAKAFVKDVLKVEPISIFVDDDN